MGVATTFLECVQPPLVDIGMNSESGLERPLEWTPLQARCALELTVLDMAAGRSHRTIFTCLKLHHHRDQCSLAPSGVTPHWMICLLQVLLTFCQLGGFSGKCSARRPRQLFVSACGVSGLSRTTACRLTFMCDRSFNNPTVSMCLDNCEAGFQVGAIGRFVFLLGFQRMSSWSSPHSHHVR